MSMPHTCRCGICGAEMGWIGMPSITQMFPCGCVGGNCCLENLPPNTGMALGGAYCKKARGEMVAEESTNKAVQAGAKDCQVVDAFTIDGEKEHG